MKPAFLIAAASFAVAMSGSAFANPIIKPYFEYKPPRHIEIPGDLSYDTNGKSPLVKGTGPFVLGFEGLSQYDAASFGRNFVPPDTIGAVGLTQYVETLNGTVGIFDKYTGNPLAITSDNAFWSRVGALPTNGDPRVMYNADAQRWIVTAFSQNLADIQIAISDTDNALGTWKSVVFTGFAGGIADYPTLALDKNAVYIGTNNFTGSFQGTTLNVIPIDSLFNAGAPTVANLKQFVTPFPGVFEDRGFAQQGVNSSSAGTTGKVVAASLFAFDSLAFNVNNLSSTDATGATLGAVQFLGEAAFASPGPGRQPSAAIAANRRVIDTLDERISSSVYEANGLIYMVHTVNSGLDALDETRVRYIVMDANTFAIVDEGDIGEAGYDYYQGSIAVNALGEVVIGYNRSGLDAATGKISFLASMYKTDALGQLVQFGSEIFIKESLTDDYHNGSVFGQPAAGRQRWGDYSQVSLDPSDIHSFYLIGQFAREYNLPQFGHPNGTGGSRWGTYIVNLTFAQDGVVPEPGTWAMMIAGFGLVGFAMRRQRAAVLSA